MYDSQLTGIHSGAVRSYAVEMRGITKRFQDVTANDNVDFAASWGEIHALIGENGAGKSTLMNILYGMYRPDSGAIRINGIETRISSPFDALKNGIGMVHQQFMLVQRFTALENILLGNEPVHAGMIDMAFGEKYVIDVCARMKLNVNLNTPVSKLTVSSMQKVEIIKAMYRGARILILDEPSSILSPRESVELFEMLRRMASEGMCIILISHKLGDVIDYSDRVTVLRKGRLVDSRRTAETNADELTSLMIGRELTAPRPRRSVNVGANKPILSVQNVTVLGESGIHLVDSVSLDVKSGEVVGIAGVDGNGQQELIESIIGIRSANGRIDYDGIDIIDMSVRERIKRGIAYIPENPDSAVIKDLSVKENAILGYQREPRFCKNGILDMKSIRDYTATLAEEYDIDMASMDIDIRHLSGGNMQKLIIGRAIEYSPRLLIASQPTRGLDVSASANVYDRILRAADDGIAVLVVSQDLDEILLLCDRVAVMYKGRIERIFERDEADKESIGAYMVGAAV